MGTKIKKIIFLVVLAAVPFPLTAETLDQYLAQVKTANPSVQAANLRQSALGELVGPAGFLDEPFVAVGPDEIPLDGMPGSVLRYQISETIPLPFKLDSRSDVAKGQAEAARFDTQTIEREIRVSATQLFFRALYNLEEIQTNNEISRTLEKEIRAAKARYVTGDANHHDWVLAQAELGVLQTEALRLDRDKLSLQAQMNELKNRPPDEVLIPESGDLFVFSESKLPDQSEALKVQPELKSAEALSGAASAQKRLASLNYLPDFTVQGMLMQSNMETQPSNWGFMVGVKVPIFWFAKEDGETASADFQFQATLKEKRVLENRLITEWTEAVQELKTARDMARLYRESILPLTEVAVASTRSSYAARKTPLLGYLEALRIQRRQKLEYLAALIDIRLGSVRLDNLLSAPPVLKFAPSTPTLLGGNAMGFSMPGMGESNAVKMGTGMAVPSKNKGAEGPDGSSSTGMGGM